MQRLSGVAALRRASALFAGLPRQLAEPMATLHALDHGPVTFAFAALIVANPPLAAPGPFGAVIGWVGGRPASRFIARHRAAAPDHDLANLDSYRALHHARVVIEAATIDARPGLTGMHPFHALVPASKTALAAVTGTPILQHR